MTSVNVMAYLTFGDILQAILIGLMFGIFRKELKLPNYSKLTTIATLL